jgi:hypothetical protein
MDGDPDPVIAQLYYNGYLKKDMFSLYLADDALGTNISSDSKAWLGGYSRDFLRTFIAGGNTVDALNMTDE